MKSCTTVPRGPLVASPLSGGLSLVELLVSAGLGLLVLGTVSGMIAQGARQTHGVAVYQKGLQSIQMVTRLFEADMSRAPSSGSLQLTATRLDVSLSKAMRLNGQVGAERIAYRVTKARDGVWIIRQGRTVAGPFVEARFEEGTSETGLVTVRLVLSAPGTGRPMPFSMQASLPRASGLPGLRAWTN